MAAHHVDGAERSSRKMQLLLMPFFATSHIGPYADFAVRLATARPGAVQVTLAVTPANVTVVRSAIERHGPAARELVGVATYPFPQVDGLPPSVENLATAGADGWRIDAAAVNEALTRPAQEALLKERSPDAVVTDVHFFWNSIVAAEIGVPCVTFSVIGAFSKLAMRQLGTVVKGDNGGSEAVVTVPRFPGPEIRIPWSELPEQLRSKEDVDGFGLPVAVGMRRSFGVAMNTFIELEKPYCEALVREGYMKRAYCVGPLSLSLPTPLAGHQAGAGGPPPCVAWLDSKPSCSVVFVCFGTYAAVPPEQLRELALGLEASGRPFLWVVRGAGDEWAPPDGWAERVGERGMLVLGWAPQAAVLAHPAVGAFMTHCGSSSLQEAVAAGVPVLSWPLVFDQFIEERLATDVLGVGARVWSGPRGIRDGEKEVVPAAAVARAVAGFLEPWGAGEAARVKARELSARAHAAVADGGSSSRDLHRLIDDLMEARAVAGAGKI